MTTVFVERGARQRDPESILPYRDHQGYGLPIASLGEASGLTKGEILMALGNVRRVVTTVDSSDKAVVLLDGDNPHTIKRPDRPTTSHLLWVTGETPADIAGAADRAALALG